MLLNEKIFIKRGGNNRKYKGRFHKNEGKPYKNFDENDKRDYKDLDDPQKTEQGTKNFKKLINYNDI